MAREVAIKVKVNGTEQAVKSIDELEGAIEALKAELKGTEIGSQSFKQLSGELQNAESKLKTLNKGFEGLEPQQKAEAFVKLGEGIAGSFAIATAALTAFGVESEDVEEAQLAITQALTAAIGFRQIAEAGLQARVVATTISQKAYNLAAKSGNAITKAFYTTLAANPITAIVLAVAALAAGIYALISAQEKEISVQEQVNDAMAEAEKNSVKQELALTSLKNVIDDTNKSDELRAKALKDLIDILPELEGLTLDQGDALEEVNKAYERNIKLIKERAKAEVLSQLIIEKTKELIETQNSSLDDNLSFWEETGNYLLYGYNPINVAVANSTTAVNNKLEKQSKLQKEIDDITREYTDLLDGLLILEGEQEEVLEETAETKERNNRATKRANDLERERQRIIREGAQEELDLLKEIISIKQAALPTPEIINALTAELGLLKSAIDQAFPETFQDRIDKIFAIPTARIDEFAELYVDFFPELSSQLLQGLDGFDEVADATLDSLAEAFVSGKITQEAFEAGVDLLNNYKNLEKEFELLPDFFEGVFDPEKYFTIVRDLKVASGVITTDIKRVNGEVVASTAITQKSLSESTEEVGNYLSAIVEQYVELGLQNEAVVEQLDKAGVAQADRAKVLEEQIQTRINNIIGLGDAIIDVESGLKKTLEETQSLLFEISQTTGEARVAAFINESEQIIQYAGFELEERKRILGLFGTEVESQKDFMLRAEKELSELIPEFEQLTRDEQLRIIDDYYQKVKAKRDENAEEEKSTSGEIIEGFSEGLQQISQVAQTGVQVFQEYVQTQLTLLQEQEKAVLDQIVGDSEEAEQKRLEVQEEYEQKRKQISKQGQLAQLQLTRVQAIANVAEAVTKALAEGPLIGQVLATISAAIGLAQVGIITSQIGQVRSLARGGLLAGNSHEYGGIPLAGGGVVAEGGEAVINRRGSIDYRNLLNEASISSGGAPIVSSSFDDTRLVEAITKQNRDPIKAYVLEQDITRSQSVNKRLQQLSKI